MDLSIKNVNNKATSFKGVKNTPNKSNVPIIRFTTPVAPNSTRTVELEVVELRKKKNEAGYEIPQNARQKTFQFKNENIELFDNLDNRYNPDSEPVDAFAYRFKVSEDGKKPYYVYDQSEKTNLKNSDWNIVIQGPNAGYTPAYGSMYHIFIDSEGKYDNSIKGIKQNKNFIRNHFNKLGGSMKSLTYLLTMDNSEFEPYKYIISTPDIGADPTSSHKYWPNNHYQCSNMDDFKTFNWELFKRGKGYVADGAFTSQSLQSPLFQHVLKWGEKSPFYSMFKIDTKADGTPSSKIAIGVLPKVTDENRHSDNNPFDHIGIKLITGDKNRPTYIQFYDDRLASEKQLSSNSLIEAYDNPVPDDHYDITTHDDSVQPFYFEVNPEDARLKVFKNGNTKLLKEFKQGGTKNHNDFSYIDDFLTFPKFKIVTKDKVAGANCWDGQVDLIKMNLTNPAKGTEEGCENAREYLYGVASFWTETIQSDILLKTAQMASEPKSDEKINTLEEVAKNNNINLDEIRQKVRAKQTASSIISDDLFKPTIEYIETFPIQSVEVSPELAVIFAEPEFNEEFLTDQNVRMIKGFVDKVINQAIPESQRNNEAYKRYAIKALTNDILKDMYVASFNPKLLHSKDSAINLEGLKKNTLKSMIGDDAPSKPEIERARVIKQLTKQLNSNVINGEGKNIIIERAKAKLQGVSLEDFKVAESLMIQSNAGLNWRFDAAKDVGDLDAVRTGNVSFNDVWNDKQYGVQSFWQNFITRIKEHNPSAYIINEITDLWSFYDNGNPRKAAKFDKTGLNPDQKERDFLARTGSTTSSNYSKYFNSLSYFAGLDPEHGTDQAKAAGNMASVKEMVAGFINETQPQAAMLSHTFTNNHDKPTILHALPLDMKLFLYDDKPHSNNRSLAIAPEEYKQRAFNVTGTKDFSNISCKAVAVGEVMLKSVQNSSLTQQEKIELTKAIRELAAGKKSATSKPNFSRSEAFGFLPYEVTIKDALKKAGIEDHDDSKMLEIHYGMLKDALTLQTGIWEMINAIVGTPTIFNGTEFAQTGYETASKNVTQAIRGPIAHNMKNMQSAGKYDYKNYYKKMNAISGLYKEKGMSSLRAGYPIVLDATKGNGESLEYSNAVKSNVGWFNWFVSQINNNGGVEAFNKLTSKDFTADDLSKTFHIDNEDNYNHFKECIENGDFEKAFRKIELELLPIYKYDDKGSKTITVITNHNVSRGELAKDYVTENRNEKVDSINITSNGNCPLEDGTILFRKVYDKQSGRYIDDDVKYIVKNGEIVSENSSIIVDDTVLNFYVPSNNQIKNKAAAKYRAH